MKNHMNKGCFVHEKALVESDNVGEDTRIWAFSHIMKDAIIGSNCNIGEHCFIENGVIVGDDVTIKNGISLWDGVVIEDNAFLGPNSVFTNDMRPRSKSHDFTVLKTIIRKGATIGANSTIICGIEIGKYSFIGAGAVVTKNVPDYTLVYGNPAKKHGYVCECGINLNFKDSLISCACGKKYELQNNYVKKVKE